MAITATMAATDPPMRSLLANSDQLGDRAAQATRSERLFAGLVAVCCLSMLCVAAILDPDPSGLNTHTRLGLPECQWPATVGIPCPTCGMTTAFAHAANGRIDRAFITQPMGAILSLAASVAFWVSVWVAATGSRIGHFLLALFNPTVLWMAAGLALLAWIYKIIVFTMQGWG